MRRGLLWALSASVVLSAVALFGTEAPSIVASVEPGIRERAQSLVEVSAAASPRSVAFEPLPTSIPRPTLAPALRDPFSPPPLEAVAIADPAPALPMSTPPPARPVPPPVNLRYLASMVSPGGQRLVYLARGDAAIEVKEGDHLDEGYRVESLTAENVTLVYPPLKTRVVIPIPPAPRQ